MSIELPQELVEALRPLSSALWPIRSQGRMALLVKVSSAEVYDLWRAPIRHRFELARDLSPSMVRLLLEITTASANPLLLQTLWTVLEPNQLHDLESLLEQGQMALYFLDADTEYTFTRSLPHPLEERQRLGRILELAKAYVRNLPDGLEREERARVRLIMGFGDEED